MKRVRRMALLVALVSAIPFALFGCGDGASSPVAPTSPVSTDQVPGVSECVSPVDGDMIGLKATAPVPLAPKDDIEINVAATAVLRALNATGCFVEENFDYEFTLGKQVGGRETEVEGGAGVQGDGSTTHAVQTRLDPASNYVWRVRAVLNGVYGPWSSDATFRTQAVVLGVPRLNSPIDGATVSSLRPIFNVRNGTVEGYTGTVTIHIQVASNADFMDAGIVGEAEERADPRGHTDLQLSSDLMATNEYFWRARALTPDRSDIAESDWTAPENFSTPAPGPTNAPGMGNCCPPPNRLDIVEEVVRATGNLYRTDIQQFTERVAECLAVIDGDWGRRLNDSGIIGKDTVAYRTSEGPGRGPYSVDIMLGAGGSDPRPHWRVPRHEGVLGRVGGSWIPVDGSGCVLGGM